ncbi:MAG: PilN domain-containing protein [Acidobacteria bacterium]|jgi:Tfp pilus assembly protein PilN|nr:PilN domain-containing protein [Acidobacteriota bacterium]
MIKINLLDSVTARNGAGSLVERRINNPMSRLLIMTATVGVLLVLTIVGDIVMTQRAKTEAERQLAEQKQIASELESVTKEMKDLDQKIQNINARIETIKKLRGSQAGPSAVLEAMRERILMVPGLYLEGIEQKGEQLTITGNSRDETQVTQFGRSLEFSSGLFSNLNIETVRKDALNQPTSAAAVSPGGQEPPKLQIVGFTIRCAYTPFKAGGAQKPSMPTTATNNQAVTPSNNIPAAPPPQQVAKY